MCVSVCVSTKRRRKESAERTARRDEHGFCNCHGSGCINKAFDLRIHGNSAVRISLSNAHWHCHFTFHSLYYLISPLISSSSIVVVLVVYDAIQPFARWQNYFANVVTLRLLIKRFHLSQMVFLMSFSFWFGFFCSVVRWCWWYWCLIPSTPSSFFLFFFFFPQVDGNWVALR